MNESSDKVTCPKCQAINFTASAVCWQCGEPLLARPETPAPEQPVWPQAPTPVYGPPPGQQPPMPTKDNSSALVIWGFICAGLGVICCPVFPIVGIILGAILIKRGNAVGTWLVVTSVLILVVGLAFTGFGVASFMREMSKHPEMYKPR